MSTPLEDQVKYMVGKFQESIKTFEDHTKLVQKAISNTANLDSKVNELAQNGQNTDQKSTDLGQKVENQGKVHQSLLSDLSTNIKQLWTNHVNVSQDLTNAKAFALSVQQKLDSALNAMTVYLKSDDVKPLYNEISSIKDKFPALASDYEKDKSDVVALIASIRSDFSAIPVSMQDLEAKVVSTIANVQAVISDVANIRKEFKDAIAALSVVIDGKIKSSIDSIPTPNIPTEDDTKKIVSTAVAPMALDAKNANLRSSNNESKITLLEKKVEQLQILNTKNQIGV